MKKAAALFLVLALAFPALADTQFRVRQMSRSDVPLGKGQCDIRLRVDGEVEVDVRGQTVSIRTISGRDARDDGSECNEPLPERNIQGFNFEVMDRRGDIALMSQPSPRNRSGAVVRIRDSEGGEGRYHFRLSWQMTGGGYDSGRADYGRPSLPPDGNSGFAQAMRVCQDAVRDRIMNQNRYRDVDFENVRADNRPGRNDYVIGDAVARRGQGRGQNRDLFTFDCSVDFRSGRVRNIDVRRR